MQNGGLVANPGNGVSPGPFQYDGAIQADEQPKRSLGITCYQNITLATPRASALRYIKGIRIYASAQNALFSQIPRTKPEVNDNKTTDCSGRTMGLILFPRPADSAIIIFKISPY